MIIKTSEGKVFKISIFDIVNLEEGEEITSIEMENEVRLSNHKKEDEDE